MNFSADVTARIAQLYLYPIKSCAGIAVQQALLLPTGLEWDRAWMVVDSSGEFVSQRELPRMALIRPQLRHSDLLLRAPGMLALHLALDAVDAPRRVRVWDDSVKAYDMGDLAAQWFSDFLGRPLRLVRFDPEQQRRCDLRWSNPDTAYTQFADSYPLLVLSQSALDEFNQKRAAQGHPSVGMERFRPNLVLEGLVAHDEDQLQVLRLGEEGQAVTLRLVKPCARCSIPDVDPATAATATDVADLLQSYRQDARVNHAVTFGMHTIVLGEAEALLRVGDPVLGQYAFA